MNRFDNVLGSEYDLFRLAVPHHDEFQAVLGATVRAYAATRRGDLHAVELGTGTGISTRELLIADARISVTGIDNEPKTLEQATQLLEEYGSRVQLVQGDLLHALRSMSDASADIVASAYTIHNLPETYREELYKEIARVLKPGGLFVNADKYALDDSVAHRASLKTQLDAFEVFTQHGRADLRDEWVRHYLEDELVVMRESEAKARLVDAGLTNIKTVYRKGMEAVVTALRK